MECCGIIVRLPAGMSPHSAYPFGLHGMAGDPWDYAVTKGVLVPWAQDCQHSVGENVGAAEHSPGTQYCRVYYEEWKLGCM